MDMTPQSSSSERADNGITPPSERLLALQAGMHAFEVWHDLTPAEKRDHILDYFSAEEWSNPEHLNILALFYSDAPQWMRIKARGKSIGVNAWDLERACQALHERLQAAKQCEATPATARPDESTEASLGRIFASSDIDVWYGALDLLADIFPQAVKWNYAKEKAKQRGISPYGLEQAVKEVVAVRKKARHGTADACAAEASLAAQSHTSALARLSEEWGVPIGGCLRHGTENSTWHLILVDGREIHLGVSSQAINEASVRAAIFDTTGQYIQQYGKKQHERWRELMELLAEVAVTVDTEEMTSRGKAKALLRGYLASAMCPLEVDTSAEEMQILAIANRPFVKNGILYVHARDISSNYARTSMPELDHAHVLEFLREMGACQGKVKLNTAKTSRSYWSLPVANLVDDEAEPVTTIVLTSAAVAAETMAFEEEPLDTSFDFGANIRQGLST